MEEACGMLCFWKQAGWRGVVRLQFWHAGSCRCRAMPRIGAFMRPPS